MRIADSAVHRLALPGRLRYDQISSSGVGTGSIVKTAVRVVIVVALVVTVAAAVFTARMMVMSRRLSAGLAAIEPVDLSAVADGSYTGEFGDFLVHARVQVTVRHGRITDVAILHQESGSGYEAAGTLDRIVAAQSPRVDAVSGATGSSRTIMVAVYRALTDH
ncbi:MAG: FMN-binding protein [Spirochaetaceae bacterium]|nr:MAG: FMN-binding protein [Spirochaetaceae bacterium]